VRQALAGGEPRQVIFVPGRLINLVTSPRTGLSSPTA
jgi:hypothetical protein